MSDRRRRRERFFADHPMCCFCGGAEAATEEDHQPGRVFFSDRVWPEGFVFPACNRCNQASREAENLVGAITGKAKTENDRRAVAARIASLRSNRPDLKLVFPTTREKRRLVKQLQLNAPGRAIADLPIMKMSRDMWEPEVRKIGHKILLALHYQCFGRPLSRRGGLWMWVSTNAELHRGELHKEMLEIATRHCSPVRSGQRMHDQFSVRWDVLDDPASAVFVFQLQQLFYFYGITTEAPEEISYGKDDEPERCFSWPAEPIDGPDETSSGRLA